MKRTKTYVGCWTCRSRGVKCDATRPACNRCTKFKRVCEGYSIKLVWGNDASRDSAIAGNDWEGAKRKRRLMFVDADMSNPVFDETYINSIIRRLDSPCLDDCKELVEGPYTVFKVAPAIESDFSELQLHDISLPSEAETASTQDGYSSSYQGASESELCYTTTSKTLFSHLLLPFLSVSSREERQLLRFWVTSASGLMISMNHPENPFRDVVIPLVLEYSASSRKLPGHCALLHSIYAFAAFNRSQLQEPANEQDVLIAAEHHQAGLQYLRQSMMEDSYGQHEAILASIILMTSIDIVAARSSHWRIHLRGGREWLKSLQVKWNDTQGGRILRQLFHCVEIIGYSHDQRTHFADTSWPFYEDGWEMDTLLSAGPDSPANDYCLHKFYGITRPVLRAIFDTSRLSMLDPHTRNEGVAALQNSLLLGNPSTLRFPSHTAALERITRHHACSWYYACMVHLQRSLSRTPPGEIQHLVEQCLYHLQTVEDLEDDSTVDGLMWPLFVSACEAEDSGLRRQSMEVFAKKAGKGVGANPCVEGLILEIWHRRDTNPGTDILRQHVMEELEVDILLT